MPRNPMLVAKLIPVQLAREACLHEQQYAFPPGRGTLNPLQNQLAIGRQRTRASKVSPRLAQEEALQLVCTCLRGCPGGVPPWHVVSFILSCQLKVDSLQSYSDMNVAGRLFTFTSCACDFDAAKAFSTRYRILLCPIACFNIASKVFVVLSAIYTSASRKVRVGPAWCPAFAVQIRMPLAEAKGCPPPPSSCALVIDPVLHELQTLT